MLVLERLPWRLTLCTGVAALMFASASCGAEMQGVPEGAIARVGDRVLFPEDLEAQFSNLGAYGQARFAGADGKRAMLDGVIAQTLLELEATRKGLADDPRVQWAVLEEHARLQLSAELERRVPTHDIREDQAALRSFYDAHIEDFSDPPRRAAQMVKFESPEDADAALAKVKSGELAFEDLGELVRSELVVRDDHRYPLFHRVLFERTSEVGDLLPVVIFASDAAWVARVHEIRAAEPRPFEDPAVQEALVSGVRGPLAAAAQADLLP